jgi:hypothetical protein
VRNVASSETLAARQNHSTAAFAPVGEVNELKDLIFPQVQQKPLDAVAVRASGTKAFAPAAWRFPD